MRRAVTCLWVAYNMLLLIDNYDSFTYNLYQYLCELACEVVVCRNDAMTLGEIERLIPSHIIISPGPGAPKSAGISLAVIQHFSQQLPILGVCLGHQALGEAFGAEVRRAGQVMHGKTSYIHHRQSGLFQGLNNPLLVTRYHSLLLHPPSLPDCFEVLAWHYQQNAEDEIMAIAHRSLPLFGVQFHPESILTEQGHQLLKNFLRL